MGGTEYVYENNSGWIVPGSGGGGGGTSLVFPTYTITFDEHDNPHATCDMSFEEVLAGAKDGSILFAKSVVGDGEDGTVNFSILSYYTEGSVYFADISAVSTTLACNSINHTSDSIFISSIECAATTP